MSLLALLAVVAWLAVPALPAAAHAVLVRTEPGPQSVVDAAPAEVTLYFSEPVRTQFGGVRVFDSALERVDSGQPRFVDDTTVATGVKPLEDGTYIVAWRVVSADSHPIRGAFTFSVGAPSASSGEEAGKLDTALSGFGSAPASVQAAAGISRSLGYLSALTLFGPLLFLLAAWRPRVPGGPTDRAMTRATARLLLRTWPVAALAGVLVLVTEASIEAGVGLGAGLLPSTFGPLFEGTFGQVWTVRMVLLAALLPLLVRLAWPAAPAGSVGAMAAPDTLEAGREGAGAPAR
ncbi:MAG: copper resistance CopC family protein, partial [Actinomycetota bacterium]